MTKNQYIQHLTQSERRIQGKDVPQKACAGVIDGLCAVIADKDVVIASKDDLISKLSRQVSLFQRQIYGRRSERLHPEDPNQLSLDFGEEQVLPLSDEQLKEEAVRVEDTRPPSTRRPTAAAPRRGRPGPARARPTASAPRCPVRILSSSIPMAMTLRR